MPSAKAKLLRNELMILKPIVSNLSIQTSRLFQDKAGELGTKANAKKIDIQDVCFDNFEASLIIPKGETHPERIILYLHGGGYTAGCLAYARGFGSVLAVKTGIRAFCVAYRLAPEHPYPAALDDIFEAYKYLLKNGYQAENVLLAGESAGGGLSFSLTHFLIDRHMKVPRAIIAISPCTDLTVSGDSHILNADNDPTLATEQVKYFSSLYAPNDLKNPYVSPLFGSFKKFPPSLIIVGGDEILLDDSRMIAAKIRREGSECELFIAEGMWHVFVLYSCPESELAKQTISEFINKSFAKH